MHIYSDSVEIQQLYDPLLTEKKIELSVLRLDKLHAIVSGNKYFKLKHYLKAARQQQCKRVITFGGKYSNHIAAAAFACQAQQLKLTIYVKSFTHKIDTPTLQFAESCGATIQFLDNASYNDLKRNYQPNEDEVCIPEGGFGEMGMMGAAEILSANTSKYDVIICASGTGTTLAGLIYSAQTRQQVIGINVLPKSYNQTKDIELLLKQVTTINWKVVDGYDFGGYAKYDDNLIRFMNSCYVKYCLPTDFVYTAKMMYAVFDMIQADYFKSNTSILAIHTGGLQGNHILSSQLLF